MSEHPFLEDPVLPGSIIEAFICTPDCGTCLGTGTVCEEHPGRAWGPMIGPEPAVPVEIGPMGECWCGAAGMPCPKVPGSSPGGVRAAPDSPRVGDEGAGLPQAHHQPGEETR